MNINNINADVATIDPSPIGGHAAKVMPSAVESVAKTEKVKPKGEQKPENEALSVEETEQVTIDLNEYMSDLQTNLRFSIYEKLDHQVVVEIKNKETDEVIKQIPSEEILEIRVKMEELTGMLLDEKI